MTAVMNERVQYVVPRQDIANSIVLSGGEADDSAISSVGVLADFGISCGATINGADTVWSRAPAPDRMSETCVQC